MNTNLASTAHASAPAGVNDFTAIRGIGSGVNSRLHGAQILTFAQLAALSPEEIMATIGKMPGMSAERIIRENWIGQARERINTVDPSNPSDEQISQNHQRYATFKVELLVDETGSLRRTNILHIQSAENASWAGWEQARLAEFVASHAGVSAPCAEEIRAGFIAQSVPLVRAPTNTQVLLMDARKTGTGRLREFLTIPQKSKIPCMILSKDELFSIQLTLDLGDLAIPAQTRLNYEATVRARNMDGGAKQVIGQVCGTGLSADTITINVEGNPMPVGTYRLEAVVTLGPSIGQVPSPILLSGGVLQIY